MWTSPDKGEGDNDLQSIVFQEDWEVLVAGINGLDCVLSGLAVTGGADMTPAVAKGAVLSNGTMFAVAAADVTITAADATNPRLDLIVVNSSGALAVRAGTPAASPKPPARTANDVVIAVVYVPANDTSIETTKIIDRRVMRTQGPIVIYKTIAAETTNNTTGAIHILNKAGSGVVIPDGLFLTGKILRVRIFGNLLVNSGTPTIVLTVAFGGVTLFADTSAVTVADADRRAFVFEMDIVAQANNDQAMVGRMFHSDLGAGITAPTTGTGDAWPAAAVKEADAVIAGAGTADMNAANRTLSVTITYNVANAADEVVVEGATVELL